MEKKRPYSNSNKKDKWHNKQFIIAILILLVTLSVVYYKFYNLPKLNEESNFHFEQGRLFLQKDQTDKAIGEFKEAVKERAKEEAPQEDLRVEEKKQAVGQEETKAVEPQKAAEEKPKEEKKAEAITEEKK